MLSYWKKLGHLPQSVHLILRLSYFHCIVLVDNLFLIVALFYGSSSTILLQWMVSILYVIIFRCSNVFLTSLMIWHAPQNLTIYFYVRGLIIHGFKFVPYIKLTLRCAHLTMFTSAQLNAMVHKFAPVSCEKNTNV